MKLYSLLTRILASSLVSLVLPTGLSSVGASPTSPTNVFWRHSRSSDSKASVKKPQRTSKLLALRPFCALDFLGLWQESSQSVKYFKRLKELLNICLKLQEDVWKNQKSDQQCHFKLFLVKYPSGVVSKASERHLFRKKEYFIWGSASDEEGICCYVCF